MIISNSIRQSNNGRAAHASRSVASNQSSGRKADSSHIIRACQRRRNKKIERLELEESKSMVGREDILRFGGVFTDA